MNENIVPQFSWETDLNFFFGVGITTACVNYAYFKHVKEIFSFQKKVCFHCFSFKESHVGKT